MKNILIAAALFASPALFAATDVPLKNGWQFSKDSISWQSVSIPHDWAIYGPFSRDNDLQKVVVEQNGEKEATWKTGRTGGLPYIGKGYYKTTFSLPDTAGKAFTLLFDGAMSHAHVYVNGRQVAYRPYGYVSFTAGLDGVARPGVNTLEVSLENLPKSSRWYPGAGLYRNVHLITSNRIHIPVWGIYLTTPYVSREYADVKLLTSLEGLKKGEKFSLVTTVTDPQGKVVATDTHPYSYYPGVDVQQYLKVPAPQLWSPESPSLYSAVVDVVVNGNVVDSHTQRFGIPMGFGGPHAAYMSCTDALKRRMPGRLIGMSIDTLGRPAYRLALQTREQHIRRDKATSNICTAQVLLAVLAAFYAVYHGQEGLKRIGTEIHLKTKSLYKALTEAGIAIENKNFFDTLLLSVPGQADAMVQKALEAGYNIRRVDADHAAISLDETATCADIAALASALAGAETSAACDCDAPAWDPVHTRQTPFCTEKAFNSYHSETEMMRYIRRLESRDLALNEAMIPLGSCTMKLNAASEMIPITWPEANSLHPFVPADQSEGIREMLSVLSDRLAKITGFAAVSLQPNAGAAGEYAGLLAIRRYQKHAGEGHRNVCLIPTSAHGTNPASSAMAGLKVVPVKCDERGNIDMADLKSQAEAHKDNLSCIMVTYPSTHGVYEQTIKELCDIVHANGGQVYMDGANMNAQVGLTCPGCIGADVCHLNLHKTFAMPHGGGGPGIGPIGVAEHLVPFLPGHLTLGHEEGAVASAAWGSASIAAICWMYLSMMGPDGLREATEMAILNANYIAKKLGHLFPVLYSGNKGLVAHECILDPRQLTHDAGLTVDDIAKRLMDYGFHGPTMSFPVPGTLMVEPTESEPKKELDRFIEAMERIHAEITAIINGTADKEDNVLKNSPHTAEMVSADEWRHPYSRSEAAYPVSGLLIHKFWPYVGRVDNVYGDRNLVCTCDTVEEFSKAVEL